LSLPDGSSWRKRKPPWEGGDDALPAPQSGTAVDPIAGGFAIYCGANSPTTQAVGMGLDGPVSEEEFDRLENFYRRRSEPVRVETCPLADASLIGHFGKRGYRVTEFSNVMALPLDGAVPCAESV